MNEARDVLLFSYGTLQDEHVQLACFGRRLVGEPDRIAGYVQSSIGIADGDETKSYPILDPTGNAADEVFGQLFRLTASELARADDYEGTEYQRVRARLRSGDHAWVYVRARPGSALDPLKAEP